MDRVEIDAYAQKYKRHKWQNMYTVTLLTTGYAREQTRSETFIQLSFFELNIQCMISFRTAARHDVN